MKFRRQILTLAAFLACAQAAQAQEVFDENAPLPDGNPQIEQQLQGDFPSMNRSVPPPLGALQHAWDNAGPEAGITRFQYEAGRSFKVTTREGMTTTIRLPEWESIEAVILGDQTIYRYQQLNDNTIEVWTTIPGSDTSLKILGDSQNIYSIYLRSETFNSNNVPDLTIYIDASSPSISVPGAVNGGGATPGGPTQSSFITGSGSGGSALTRADSPSPDWIKAIGYDPSRIRRDTAMFGDAELAPDDIFRDDQFTYMCFGEQWDDSALMVAAPYEVVDGVDRQVNFRVAHNCMIIETTGPLTLRRGEKVLCVRDDPTLVKPRRSAASARVQPLLPPQQAPKAPDVAPEAQPQNTAPQLAPVNPTSSTLPPDSEVNATPISVKPKRLEQ